MNGFRFVAVPLLGAGLLTLNGCLAAGAVAALGIAGNVADIGSAAFSTGTEVFSGGKLESVEFTTLEDTEKSVRSTLNDLRLRLTTRTADKIHIRYDFEDDYGSKVRLDVIRRTEAIVQIRIDVGYFGSEAYARLLLKSVRARLPAAARRPTSQPVNPVDLDAPREFPGFTNDDSDEPSK